jgi:epoxyqueuosine reductase
LDSTDQELLERFGSWYLAERNPKWLRRNALIILGNIAPLTMTNDPSDSVERMLRKYLGDIDPLLRAHALWAAIRLGRQDLVSLVERDADSLVQDELNNQSSVPVRTVAL